MARIPASQNCIGCFFSHVLTAFFHFFIILIVFAFHTLFHGTEKVIVRGSQSGKYDGCGRVVHPNEAIVYLVLMRVWGRALSYNKRTLPMSMSGHTPSPKSFQSVNIRVRVDCFCSLQVNKNDSLGVPKDICHDLSSGLY
ncbi:hypothetical protein ElyMa_005814200 [Elysia marginata]|uniref:Uncharacterized protein n=1 Tax=Elysia marginata TaxID=1093978 RepID=A0AAV4FVT9_9GAST|nr:hypothetical protein ElyMa_005814200 [Elysia marginata]